MAQTNYSSKPFLYSSRGLSARYAPDRVPQGFYIDCLNIFEREENTFSSRYGSQILNRDAAGAGTSNYFFTSPVTSLARLLYRGAASRIAGLADGTLWQGPGYGQGAYTQIYSALSGQTFSSVVTNCFETSQPYLFIYDAAASIKIPTGTPPVTPQLTGIDPPDYTANAQPYAPLLTLIAGFSASNYYSTTNVTGWVYNPVTTLQTFTGSQVTDFPQFFESALTQPGGTTTATASANNSTTTTTIYSGFAADVIDGTANLTIPISASVLRILGATAGSGSLSIQISTDGGATYPTVFYSWSSTVPGSLPQTSVSGSLYVGNAANLWVKLTVIANSQSSSTVQTTVTLGTLSLSPANIGAFSAVVSGMVSELSASDSANVALATVYATQYLTNLSYNTSQYEYNAPLLRTSGGVGGGVLTDPIIAFGFGLSIPTGATIDGIEATINWEGQAAGDGILKAAQLYYSGAPYGTAKSLNIYNNNYFTQTLLGSASDSWGATLTPAIVNSSGFGFQISVQTVNTGTTRSFFDWWQLKVYYTLGGGGGSAGVTSSVPITSVVSSGYDAGTGLYTTLTITTAAAHGLVGNPPVAVYGASNDLADGFYTPTSLPSSTTIVVPYSSPVAISATGGTLWSVTGGAPNYCVLANLYTTPYPTQLSAWGFYAAVPTTVTQFPVSSWEGTVATNTTAYIENTLGLDLSQNNQVNDFDLLVLTLKVGAPANVASIKLQFDVASSGYSSSYYTATISPAYYQGALTDSVTAYDAATNQVLADALGILTGQQPTGTTTAQLSPSNFSTGAGAWVTVYIPRGNFLPVGTAGQPGLDWSAITGWRLVVETTATANTGDGSSLVACNGLYLQWGYGPSSFAGVGYDWRYTYYNANTGTESSPSPIQNFSTQYGYLSSLAAPFYFRQAGQITGLYSTDAQVTHLRVYRRGGQYSSNWFRIDQVPNLTGGGQFQYKDVVGDAALAQAPLLVEDNDPPVTSSLSTPIQTTLAVATSAPGQSYYSTYAPQTVTVANATAQFVTNQVVAVGNAYNLEEVLVVSGGTGQFTAILRLQHNAGEQVSSTSTPRAACSLAALSNQGGVKQVWLAGDPQNPHYLYYSKPGLPENFSPAGYIPVSAPDDPIMAVINWRGTIVVGTQKTWYIIIGGAKPYPQPTGSTHGMACSSWTLVEGRIIYLSQDGLRAFSGADGVYMTLPVEWMFRQTPPTLLVPRLNATDYAQAVLAMYQNQAYCSFVSASSTGGARYRLRWDDEYRRFSYDDVPATAMLWEQDTNALVVGRQIGTTGSNYALVQDWVGDYDDGGWSAGALVQTPVTIRSRTPYIDLGRPHFPKQWNMLEGDYDTQDQPIQTTLYFKGEEDFSVALPAQNLGAGRSKYQFQLPTPGSASDPLASGIEAYSMSVQHEMAVTVAPTLFQEDVYAILLADERTSFDTYWQKFEGDYLGIFPKNIYCDYTAGAQLVVEVYADGSPVPYYKDSTTLVPQTNRSTVRVQLPAHKGRLWRVIITSAASFQLWSAVRTDTKPLCEGSGYAQTGFPVYQ